MTEVKIEITKFYPKGTPYKALYPLSGSDDLMTFNRTEFTAAYGVHTLKSNVSTITQRQFFVRHAINREVRLWVRRFRLPEWFVQEQLTYTLKVRA